MHKKTCSRPGTIQATPQNTKKEVDVAEVSEQLQSLLAGQS